MTIRCGSARFLSNSILLTALITWAAGTAAYASAPTYRILPHQDVVTCLAFSPDSTLLAAGSEDRTIKLWNSLSGSLLRTLGPFRAVKAVAFSPNGRELMGCTDPGLLRAWNPKTGQQTRTLNLGDPVPEISLAYSPNGKWIAASTWTQPLLLDAVSGQILRRLYVPFLGGSVTFYSLAFSPDGRTLAGAGSDFQVHRWDLRTGAEIPTPMGRGAEVKGLAYSPDGKLLVSVGKDNRVQFLHLSGNPSNGTLGSHNGESWSVAFSPDGKLLATGGRDQVVRLWDPQTGRQEAVLRGHNGNIIALAFSPDGRLLASGSDDHTVHLWSLPPLLQEMEQASSQGAIYGEPPDLNLQVGHIGAVQSMEFFPDGRYMVTGGDDRTIRLWDTVTGEELRTLKGYLETVTAHILPGGRIITGASTDGSIKLWDVQTGKPLRLVANHGWPVAFSPDGQTVASSTRDSRTLLLWDLRTGEQKHVLKGHKGSIESVAFSPDGKMVASGSNDSTVRLWDTQTGNLLHLFEPPLWSSLPGMLEGAWWRMGNVVDPIYALAFSPDGTTLATGCRHGAVNLWNTRTGRLRRSLSAGPSRVNSLTFSPDGSLVAAALEAGMVRLWDVPSGTLQESLNVPLARVVAFAPTLAKGVGRRLAIGSEDHFLLYNVDKHRVEQTWGQTSRVNAMILLPDGLTLAAGGSDGTVKFWSPVTGVLERTFSRHEGAILSMASSTDGSLLVTAGSERTLKLWNLQTGQVLWTSVPQPSQLTSVGFSPDGKLLVSGNEAAHLSFWEVPSGKLLKIWDLSREDVGARMEHNLMGWGPGPHPVSAAFSPDGQVLVVWGEMDAWIYDPHTGNVIRSLHPGSWTFGTSFAADGKSIAIGVGQSYKRYDLHTGRELNSWPTPSQEMATAFSPDGKMLSTGDTAGVVTLFNLTDSAPVVQLRGHQGIVYAVTFSFDGKRLFSSSLDGTIRVWDTRKGRLLATLLGLSGGKGWFAVTPEGYFDCSADAPQLVRWEIGGKLYPAERYIRRFRRPDLVRKALQGEVINPPPISVEDIPPSTYFSAIRYSESDPGASVIVSVDAYARHALSEIQLTVNGRPLSPAESRPIGKLIYPTQAGARPIVVTSKPIVVTSKPIVVTSKPIVVTAKSILITAKPIAITPGPLELTRSRWEFATKLFPTGARPIVVTSKPLELSARGLETNYTIHGHYTFRVTLPAGAGEVSLRAAAYDRTGLGSDPHEIMLRRQGAPGVSGNLYALCVGISHYLNGSDQKVTQHRSLEGEAVKGRPEEIAAGREGDREPGGYGLRDWLSEPDSKILGEQKKGVKDQREQFHNLQFPARDARTMASRLRREGQPLYRHVEVHTLLDQQATLENLRHELRWLQRSARPGQVDTAIVFLSGHGISDSRGHYHFPAYDFNQRRLASTSLSGQQIQEELGGKLRARDVFLFVDTCHSGALAGARTDDLSFDVRSSGVYMMASSGAGQYSYESPRWRHGAFTLAMLRSLSRRDLAIKGIIHFNALASAIPEELARLLRQMGQNEAAEEAVIPLEGHSLLEPVTQVR